MTSRKCGSRSRGVASLRAWIQVATMAIVLGLLTTNSGMAQDDGSNAGGTDNTGTTVTDSGNTGAATDASSSGTGSDGTSSGSTDGGTSGSGTDSSGSTDSSGTGTDDSGSTGSTDPTGIPIFIPLDQPGRVLNMSGGGHLMTPPSFVSMGATPNQRLFGTALDSVTGSATGNTADLIAQIQGLTSPTAQQTALASMDGEVYGTIQTLGLELGDRTLRLISNRIVNNDVFLNDGQQMLLGQSTRATSSDPAQQIVRGQAPVAYPSLWLQGYGGTGHLSSNGNATGAGYRMGGVSVGVDLARDESGMIGLTGGTNSMSFHTGLGDIGQVQAWQMGAYVVKRLENVYSFGIMNYGHNDYSVSRNIVIGNMGQLSSSQFTGNQFGSYGELGATVAGTDLRLQPFLGLQYLYLSNGSAFENGAGGTALAVDSASISTLQTHLGLRVIHSTWRDCFGFDWTPYLNARWIAELLGEQPSALATLSSSPNTAWVVQGDRSGRNFGMFSPGVTVRITEGISLFANYDQVFGARFQAYTASGGFLLQF